jgi:hypothetical protein
MKAKARQPAQGPGGLPKALNPETLQEQWSSNAQAAAHDEACAQFSDDWQNLLQELSFLDLMDPSNWSEPITDPDEYFWALFGA